MKFPIISSNNNSKHRKMCKVNGAKVVINTHTKSISTRQKHEHKHRGEKAEN